MPRILLATLLNANGESLPFDAAHVFDRDSKKSVKELIDGIQARIEGLEGKDVEELKIGLEELKTTFSTFMTGEDDDNGALDRLRELVAAIQANRTSIDALIADKATQNALDAVIARVTALEDKSHDHDNKSILDGISENPETGNLVFNGKELTGETGIAIGTGAATSNDFTGKIRIVVEEVSLDEEASA